MKFSDPQNQTDIELLDASHLKLTLGYGAIKNTETIERLLVFYLRSMSDRGTQLNVFVDEKTSSFLLFHGELTDILDALYRIGCISEFFKTDILEQYAVAFLQKVSSMISPSKQPSFFHKISATMGQKSKKPPVRSHFLKGSISSSSV